MMPTLYWLPRTVKELPIHQALLTNFAMPILPRIGNKMKSKVCFKISHYVILHQDLQQIWLLTSLFENEIVVLICALQIPSFSATEQERCLTLLHNYFLQGQILKIYAEFIKNVAGFQTTYCLPIMWIVENIKTVSSSCWTTHHVKERKACFCWEVSQELHTMQILLLQINPWSM